MTRSTTGEPATQASEPLAAHPAAHDVSRAARAAAILVALLGFLPWYNWLPTGHDSVGYQWMAAQGALTAMALGAAVALAFASERLPFLWHPGAATAIADEVAERAATFALLTAVAALLAYLIVAVVIFGRHPADVDDAVQLLQARAYARGSLWQELGPHPEFFVSTHDVVRGTRAFAQFPPGHPALLAIGVLLRAPWIIVPLAGAGCAWLYARIVAMVEPRASVWVAASLLLPFTPFMLGLAGSQMNHVTALCALLLATYGLVRTTRPARVGEPRPWRWPLLAGLGLGAAATIRPLDALAFALPAAGWLLARLWGAPRDRERWSDALLAGAGVAIPMLPMLWVNAHTTGGALTFGYTALWGGAHELGFHQAPYGPRHTPLRGIALVSFYFNLLQQALFASPIPSLVPVVGALWMARRLRAFDRYLLAASGLLCVGYWLYWYRGLVLGPRFLLPLLPALVLWAARFPAFVRERAPNGEWHRITVFAVIACLGGALFSLGPLRFHELRRQFAIARADVAGMERMQRLEGGLVLVREHWGNTLVARLWALGVPHPDAARAFDNADLCRLDAMISRLETAGADTVEATRALRRLLGDSLQTTRKVIPGTQIYMAVRDEAEFTPTCRARTLELARGTLPLAQMRVFEGRNVYARDLHARDTLLLARYPGRPVWVLEPTPGVAGAPRLLPLNLDSALADWEIDGRDARRLRRAVGSY